MPKVLVIDDSVSVRKVVERALAGRHIEVVCAASGTEALQRIEQDPPDVIVCDVVMPDRDGYEICEFVKNHPRFSGTPVVLMSGIVNDEVRERAARVRSEGVLAKPFAADDLLKRLDGFLGPLEAAAETRPADPSAPSATPTRIAAPTPKPIATPAPAPIATPTLMPVSSLSVEPIAPPTAPTPRPPSIPPPIPAKPESLTIEPPTPRKIPRPDPRAIPSLDALKFPEPEPPAPVSPPPPAAAERLTPIEAPAPAAPLTAPPLDLAPPALETAPASPAPPSRVVASAAATPSTPATGDSAAAILAQFTAMDGVQWAVLADREGFVVESTTNVGVDGDVAAALSACLAESSDGLGRELGRGALQGLILEYEKGMVLVFGAGATGLLAVGLTESAVLGKVRYFAKKTLPELTRIL